MLTLMLKVILEYTKQYWKTVRLCLTKKTSTDGRITLIENVKVTSGERESVKIVNEYFSNILSNLKDI